MWDNLEDEDTVQVHVQIDIVACMAYKEGDFVWRSKKLHVVLSGVQIKIIQSKEQQKRSDKRNCGMLRR